MIDFSICKNCGLPIFFDWQGAHHVRPESYGPLGFLQCNPESEPCGKAEEEAEESSASPPSLPTRGA